MQLGRQCTGGRGTGGRGSCRAAALGFSEFRGSGFREVPVSLLCQSCFRLSRALRDCWPTSLSFAAELPPLAAKCDELGLTASGDHSPLDHIPRPPGRQYLFLPPIDDSTRARGPGDRPSSAQWYEQLPRAAGEQAAASVRRSAQGERCRASGPVAYHLLHEVLARESRARGGAGHPASRLRRCPQRWAVQQPKVPHATLGWPAGKHWRLETPHFVIVTNHSPREAQELARQLEDLHAAVAAAFLSLLVERRGAWPRASPAATSRWPGRDRR